MQDELAAVRDVFVRRANDDAVAFTRCRSALGQEMTSPAALAHIRTIAHGLAGAGGIFGFWEISNTAATLEEAVIITLSGTGTSEDVAWALDRVLDCIETDNSCREERADRRLHA